jgi:hypothetical protein
MMMLELVTMPMAGMMAHGQALTKAITNTTASNATRPVTRAVADSS